jgi:chromosome segregation ATPase
MSVYDEKMNYLSQQIATIEGEYENLSMQLYRHETDLQRFEFVKTSFLEDLQQINMKLAAAKSYIDDLSHLQLIPDEDAKVENSSRSLRVWRSSKSSSASQASSTNQYYLEKLTKLEKHIRSRENELNKLVQELRKLELDSQIFIDLERDINIRLSKKETYLSELHHKLQAAGSCEDDLVQLNILHGKELEERDHLISELTRLRTDGKAFQDLFHLLSEDRATKESHLNRYKKKHFDLAKSVGLPSPHADHCFNNSDNGDGDADDSSSVTSIVTLESELSSGKILQSVYDQKVASTKRDIAKYEAEKALIQADLAKVQDDTSSFNFLAESIKSKLEVREKQLQALKKNQADFRNSISAQEKEFLRLLRN